jgi:hypothetical protein
MKCLLISVGHFRRRTAMISELDLAEYLDEIRKEVCSRCVEKPMNGPPCAPLGKNCGVELHLPALIQAIQHVHSPFIEPYLDHDRQEICAGCAFLGSDICPCPMDSLAVLIVQAVETVDQRRRARGLGPSTPENVPADGLKALSEAFERAAGRWTGCDWHTHFGRHGLDLKGFKSSEVQDMAREMAQSDLAADWKAAAVWLAHVEHHALDAREKAAAALEAARADNWADALALAQSACALELVTGRPLRHENSSTWHEFGRLVEVMYLLRHRPQHEPATQGSKPRGWKRS